MKRTIRLVLLVSAACFLASCDGHSEPRSASAKAPPSSPTPPAPGTCPLTLVNHSTPPGSPGWGAGTSYGKGRLWTVFWPHNLVIADNGYLEKDGSIRMKWPWWRGVRGDLTITGHRLDGKSPPLTADSSSAGYGASGFVPSSIYFPTEGCWQVTGTVRNARLTFVTLVVKASTYSLRSDSR